MSFNQAGPSRNAGLGRKVKRVSDVAALGMAPMAGPGYPQPSSFESSFNSPMSQGGAQAFDGNGLDQPTYGFNAPMQNTNLGFQSYPSGDGLAPALGFAPSPGFAPLPGFTPAAAQIGSMLQQPMVQDMAMQYGQQLASQGKDLVHREIEKYVPVSRLKYYFAVDTKYVINKLLLIFFPYTNKDWSIKYEHDSPLQPRLEPNAPDLYIPTMAYVTYVLLSGFVLGMQHRFSPEQIGIQASSALAYSIFEICLYMATLYITNIQTNLSTLDLLSFSGYKYTIIIASVLTSIVFQRVGYYSCLIYCSISLAFFLVRTLKVQVLIEPTTSQGYPQDAYSAPRNSGGSKRRVYFLLFVATMQPILAWWLTHHLLPLPLPTAVAPGP